MQGVTDIHEEKETLAVDVLLPGHEARITTSLFAHSKKQLVERDGDHCFICGRTSAEAGPLEAHHKIIERCLADGIDFKLVQRDCEAGMYGPHAQAFDWDAFWKAGDVYRFVDDMTVNGVMLCKDHHTHKGTGIHTMPWPLYLAQRYLREGYQFTQAEIIHHEV